MAGVEFLNGLWQGEPGGAIDEAYSDEIGDYLYFTYHNEKGQLLCYVMFPRDFTPKEISYLLRDCADALEVESSKDLTIEEITERAKIFREQAAIISDFAPD